MVWCSTCRVAGSNPTQYHFSGVPLLAAHRSRENGSCSHGFVPTGIVRTSLRGNSSRRIMRVVFFLFFFSLFVCAFGTARSQQKRSLCCETLVSGRGFHSQQRCLLSAACDRIFGKYAFSLPPEPNDLSEISMTFLEFLQKHDLEALIPTMVYSQSVQGYGLLREVPALYGLMWASAFCIRLSWFGSGKRTARDIVLGLGVWLTVLTEQFAFLFHESKVNWRVDRMNSRTHAPRLISRKTGKSFWYFEGINSRKQHTAQNRASEVNLAISRVFLLHETVSNFKVCTAWRSTQ